MFAGTEYAARRSWARKLEPFTRRKLLNRQDVQLDEQIVGSLPGHQRMMS
jgi:hypothetical protein